MGGEDCGQRDMPLKKVAAGDAEAIQVFFFLVDIGAPGRTCSIFHAYMRAHAQHKFAKLHVEAVELEAHVQGCMYVTSNMYVPVRTVN